MSRTLAIAAVLLALILSACVEETRPSGCDEDAVEIAVTVTADAMTPSSPSVCRGQDVTMLVDAEVNAVFHIHGYDDAVPATDVVAGETTRLEFTADRAGQFPIEIHPEDDPRGVEVGILTVHAS